ncbi:MAG TPA: hypothetical protein VF644_11525 [Pyrinomonadaceae bacterium]|jgi:hypothetical protein
MIKHFCFTLLLALLSFNFAVAQIPQERATDSGCNATLINPHWKNVEADEYKTAEGVVQKVVAADSDFPPHHWSHDWDFHVKLDDAYKGLNSTANENGVMAMEWEMNNYPLEFRPIVGDRIWAVGRWIWDCGHRPYKTEFHPPIATAVTRDEPSIFPGDTAPSLTKKTYVYIHGDGGYHKSKVTGRNYQFDIVLPSKPSSTAELRAEVVAVPYGEVKPALTLLPAENKVRVNYSFSGNNDPSPNLQFGAIILSGWRESRSTLAYRELRISLENIKINEDHDGFLDPGDGSWHMWAQAGPRWFEVLRGTKGPGNRHPESTSGDVKNGKTVSIKGNVNFIVLENGSIPLTLRSTGWESDQQDDHFGIDNRPNVSDFLNISFSNDRIGVLDASFSNAQNFGIGNQDVKSKKNPDPGSDNDTKGDFNFRFRVEEVKKYPIGTPPVVPPLTELCTSTMEPFRATKEVAPGDVREFPSYESLRGDSRVTIMMEVTPYKGSNGQFMEQSLLVRLPGRADKVKLVSGAEFRKCQFYFGQLSLGKVKADEVNFEFQLNGRPYEGRGPGPEESKGGRTVSWSSYGMTITIQEEYYYGKGKER